MIPRNLAWTGLPIAMLLAVVLGSCIDLDKSHADAVAALGPEKKGEEEDETHRPGQPCTVCHGGKGPGEPDFIVAGTVYKQKDSEEPARGVTVRITAWNGETRQDKSNEAGNFYIKTKEWPAPVFPLRVEVVGARTQMETLIGRDGGCGTCHQGSGGASHMPRVYLQ